MVYESIDWMVDACLVDNVLACDSGSSVMPLRYSTSKASDVASLVEVDASSMRRSVFLKVSVILALVSMEVRMKYSMPSTARKTW